MRIKGRKTVKMYFLKTEKGATRGKEFELKNVSKLNEAHQTSVDKFKSQSQSYWLAEIKANNAPGQAFNQESRIEGWQDGRMAEANRKPRPNQILESWKSDSMCMLVTFCWQQQWQWLWQRLPEVQVLTAFSVDRWRKEPELKERNEIRDGK